MDKKRRVINSTSGLDNELIVVSNLKKERTKKLTSVVNNKANSSKQMDRDLVSHRQESITNGPGTKKFKKVLHDRDSVDHASVPRKLRSAMKRNYEFIPTFTDSKRPNRAISRDELPKKNGVKKTKQYNKEICSDVLPKQTVSGSIITKDEEEVAETLFVLAGMFLDEDEKNKNNKQEDGDSPTNAFEDSAVTKDKLNSVFPAKISDYTLPADLDSSTKGKENVKEHHNLHKIKKFQIESETSIPQVNLPFIRPTSPGNVENLSSKPANICILPKLTVDSRIKQPTFLGSSLLERKPEIALGARATESQLSQQLAMSESWKNGLLMWPGSSSTSSYRSQILNAPSQVPASKNPPWLDAALSSSKPNPLENGSSNGKDPKLNVTEKPFKRCAAHVYICHLIQSLQTPCKTTTSHQSNLSRQNEGSKQQFLTVVKDTDMSRNGFQEHGPRNLNEDGKNIIQHNNQPQAASYKQSFDFLSLTAGGGSGVSPGNYARSGYGLESRSQQFQVPFIQQQTFSMTPTRYSSSAYSDQLAAAHQVQMQRPHIGSSLNGMSTRASIYTNHSTDKQQQHQFWAAATQQRSTAQYPSWQNGRLESSASLELLKYPQQLASTGVGFRNNGSALSLQLLCNDRLY